MWELMDETFTYLYRRAGRPSSSRSCTARGRRRSRARIQDTARIHHRTGPSSRSYTCQTQTTVNHRHKSSSVALIIGSPKHSRRVRLTACLKHSSCSDCLSVGCLTVSTAIAAVVSCRIINSEELFSETQREASHEPPN